MVPFKIGDISFELPSSYGELTLGQFDQLKKADGKLISELAILSGVDKKILEQSKDLDIDWNAKNALSFFEDPFDCDQYIVPDYITIGGKRYKTPGGIGINTFGQKLSLQQEISKTELAGGSEVDIYPFVIALYMQPAVTGKPYDSDEVDKLIPEIMNCKLAEAWPLAGFFLSNYVKYSSEKAKNYHTPQPLKRSGLALTGFKSSESSRPYSLWRRFLIGTLNKFYSLITTPFSLRFYVKRKEQDIVEG